MYHVIHGTLKYLTIHCTLVSSCFALIVCNESNILGNVHNLLELSWFILPVPITKVLQFSSMGLTKARVVTESAR